MAAVDGDAAETLVEIENPLVQQQFVRTYQQGDVDADDVAKALNRRAELNGREQSAADELVSKTGTDGRQTYHAVAAVDADAAETLVDVDNPLTHSNRRPVCGSR